VLEDAPELAELISEVLTKRTEALTSDPGRKTDPGVQRKEEERVLLDRIKSFFSLSSRDSKNGKR